MGKQILAVLIAVVTVFTLFAGCNHINPTSDYDDNWIIGKTSKEIEERYGVFDTNENDISEDGLYRNTRCGYITAENIKDFWGSSHPDEFYMIHFDKNGIAYKITKEYPRAGG